MRATAAIFLLTCVLPACSTVSPGQSDSSISASNFLWIEADFCSGGQPSLEDLEKLKNKGVKSVLNLRRPDETDLFKAEGETAESLGLKYFNIPVDASNIQPGQVDDFLGIVSEEENRPLFIHCASANRVGGFWIVYRVVEEGWSFEKAEEEARRIGLRSPRLVEFARRYLKGRH